MGSRNGASIYLYRLHLYQYGLDRIVPYSPEPLNIFGHIYQRNNQYILEGEFAQISRETLEADFINAEAIRRGTYIHYPGLVLRVLSYDSWHDAYIVERL